MTVSAAPLPLKENAAFRNSFGNAARPCVSVFGWYFYAPLYLRSCFCLWSYYTIPPKNVHPKSLDESVKYLSCKNLKAKFCRSFVKQMWMYFKTRFFAFWNLFAVLGKIDSAKLAYVVYASKIAQRIWIFSVLKNKLWF